MRKRRCSRHCCSRMSLRSIRATTLILALTSTRIAPAIGLRLVDAERIELGELVQESRLRRDAHRELCGRNQDGLTQLPIPGTKAELAPFEGGELELGRFQICDQ